MATTTQNTQGTKTVSQGESRYGSPQPQLEVRFPKGTPFRRVNAALHQLAAEIELATPASERWNVEIDVYYDACGRVYLELSDATPAETERAMALLTKLAG